MSEEKRNQVSVLLPYPFDHGFDYAVAAGTDLLPGQIVQVPFGRRQCFGVVWDTPPQNFDPDKLKFVTEKIDLPLFPEDFRTFLTRVAAYVMAPLGEVLALAFKPGFVEKKKNTVLYRKGAGLTCPVEESFPEKTLPRKLTPQQQRVLAVLEEKHQALPLKELTVLAGVSSGVILTLKKRGLISETEAAEKPVFTPILPGLKPLAFSPSQEKAVQALQEAVKKRAFSVTLLEGVTGSGKTEVYFEAVNQALAEGRQVLLLLPEIALSAQIVARFTASFGRAPALWHSDLTPKQRRDVFQAVLKKEASVVIGARSALFLPFQDLGLIVVDEEHESSYKQEEGVLYHARDMAVWRAKFSKAPVILVSATPSLETVRNVWEKRYAHLFLESRHGGAFLPAVKVVDLRQNPPERGSFIGPELALAAKQTLERGEQVLFFLNRRGYAPLTLCQKCGYRFQCQNCSAWLVRHKKTETLQCHHCGYSGKSVTVCPECLEEDTLVSVGPGVERIMEEAQKLFPEASLLAMTGDTLSSRKHIEEAEALISSGKVQIIVGTQVVAKGWHFPDLTLAGVIDADIGLQGGDLRASEKTMQLLIQIAGRAGRGQKQGQVYIQSFFPENPVITGLVSGDIAGFLRTEAFMRQSGFWPPFGHLAALIISSGDPAKADQTAFLLGKNAAPPKGVTILGPAPAPMAVLRGLHRRRLLLKAERGISVQTVIRQWLATIRIENGVKVTIDIDPVSFF